MSVDGASYAGVPSGLWLVDSRRSSVAFVVKHMVVATVDGHFRDFVGMLEIGAETSQATGVVMASSVETNDATRDEHLRNSPDFFDVTRYPEISFTSSRIDSQRNGGFHIEGELTMRGVTRAIGLHGHLKGTDRDASGDEWIQLQLWGDINRRDFGLTWNQALETGGALLGNKVKLMLDLSAVKRQVAQPMLR